jgi:hypothetical protein
MADIYLRSVPADANTADVRLYDPTAADAPIPPASMRALKVDGRRIPFPTIPRRR